MNRRDFLKASLATSGAFLLGINFAACSGGNVERMRDTVKTTGAFQPNAWITVTPDNRILFVTGKTEMGQGVFTSGAMLVAEELEVPLEAVEAGHAPAGPDFQLFGLQQTGGSTSMSQTFIPIRVAAASTREMLIGAAAARWNCPRKECRAVEGEVRHSSGKSLAYGELASDAARQPIPDDPPLKRREDFEVIGKRSTRPDIRPKVTGEAEFGIDVQIDGMVKAVVVRPPVLGSEVDAFDAQRASAMPGVVNIFAFERGVAVVAEKHWQAMRAAKEVEVRWKEGPLEGFESERMAEAAKNRALSKGSSVRDDGDVDDAFEEGATVIEATYEGPYLAHAPLEPQNATAWVRDGKCDVWAPNQWQSAVQAEVSELLDIGRDDVNVTTTFLGGGFGRRLMIDYVIEAVLISREVGKPVQVLYSREDDTRGGYYRPLTVARLKGALDAEGMPTGLWVHIMNQNLLAMEDWLPGILPGWMPRVTRLMMGRIVEGAIESESVPNVLATEGARDATYEIPSIRVDHTVIRVPVSVNFWRSVGHSVNGFVMEGFIDELAHAAGEDPFAFRMKLLKKDGRKKAVLERAAELGNWGDEIDDGWGRGIAVHKSFGTYVAQVIEAGVFDGEIRVRRVVCVVDCGFVVNPDIVEQQMESCIIQGLSAAIMQKIDFRNGRVVQGNFDTFPMMRLHETPEIETFIIDSKADPSGVGEPGLPPVAPALAGAIFAATGKRLRKMPFNDALKGA